MCGAVHATVTPARVQISSLLYLSSRHPGVDLVKQTKQLKDVFDQLDADRQGSLDIHELKPFIEFFVTEYVGFKDVDIDPIFCTFVSQTSRPCAVQSSLFLFVNIRRA